MPSDIEVAEGADTTSFACALCGKSFARRDLRNRHRRRCEKSIGKVRVSKKRSCDACGKSKLRCDLLVPSCSRCQSRGIPCQYPNDSAALAAQRHHAGRNDSITSIGTDMTALTDDLLPGHFSMSASSTASMTGYNTPLNMSAFPEDQTSFPAVMDFMMLDNMPMDTEAFSRSATGFWDSPAMGLLPEEQNLVDPLMPTYGLPMSFAPSDTAFTTPPNGDVHFVGSRDNALDQKMPFRPRPEDSLSGSMFGIDTPPSDSPVMTMSDTIMPFGQQTLSSSPTAYLTSHPSPMTRHGSSSGSSPDDTDTFLDLAAESMPPLPTPAPSRNASIASLDQLHMKARGLSRHGFDIEEAARVICEYPQRMLNKSYASPYVHTQLHHCSKSGLPEPIAVAMCCVSAKSSSDESSLPFVCNMMDAEREKLIKEFLKKPLDLDDTSSFIHALCIYQIESMLALRKSKPKNAVLSAEIHHRVLLKMARTVLRNSSNVLRDRRNQDVDYRTWAGAESLRRNLFLVCLINDLSYATQALNHRYYEPIEIEYLADMPLPAPDAMWKAMTPSEWASARNETRWSDDGVLTLGQAISRLNRGQDLSGLDPLQRLVVGCVWRRL